MNRQNYSKEELNFMLDEGGDYISETECVNDHNCEYCCDLEQCYFKVNIRLNSEYAESIDYAGCDSEEEFWEQL